MALAIRCSLPWRRLTRPSQRQHTPALARCSPSSQRLMLQHPHQRISTSVSPSAPPTAPRIAIDVRHIRSNPELYSAACTAKNYPSLAGHPERIRTLFEAWKTSQQRARGLRERNNLLRTQLSHAKTFSGRDYDEGSGADSGSAAAPTSPANAEAALEEARAIKEQLAGVEAEEKALTIEMNTLAEMLPNLVSAQTPVGEEARLVRELNPDARPVTNDGSGLASRSHVLIGTELDVLDLAAAGHVSGWGWYYLKNEGALLEQALVQYALGAAVRAGFAPVSPPSVVYSHVGAACGFRPRDAGGENQTYTLADTSPQLSLTATAEIPLAGLAANAELAASDLPRRVVAASRCFRAEAGSRGADAKGLYRVHEFTKVEMFGWTAPQTVASDALLDDIVAVQVAILEGLGLRARLLEQPSTDLGASAARKLDIEAFFPSRVARDNAGWGELTSTSNCTDYQTRRLNTRVKAAAGTGRMEFPHTVNGTALAVPRVIAAILENYWDAKQGCVHIPEALWPWMHGATKICKKR